MITKRNGASNVIRRVVLSAILSFIFAVQSAYTFEGTSNGTLIQATPFDHQLSQAGFFNEGIARSQTSSQESINSLFLKARSFRYVHDPRQDQWMSPEETEIKHSGDCKDKALWLYTELKRNGYSNVRLVIGKYRSFDKVFHAWVLCTDDSNITYLLDPTIQKQAWQEAGFAGGFYQPLYSFNGQNRYRHAAS
jgi:hypothetical protein